MNEINSAFTSLVQQFLLDNEITNSVGNTILVCQGFPSPFYEALSSWGIRHFSGDWNGTYPEYDSISGKKLLPKLMASQGLCWAFYEELIALTDLLTDFSVYGGDIIIVKNNLFDGYYPLAQRVDASKVISAFENEKSSQDDACIFHFYSDYRTEGAELLVSYVNKHYPIDITIEVKELDFYNPHAEEILSVEDGSQSLVEIAISALPEKKCLLQKGAISNIQFLVMGDNSPSFQSELSALNTLGAHFGVSFSTSGVRERAHNAGGEYLPILRKYWGNDADFRTHPFYKNPATGSETVDISQGAIINDIIHQCNGAMDESNAQYSDVIVTAPTGAGKSIFFQIPGIYLQEHSSTNAITLVVCPLVALMIDQVKELNDRGIEYATYINSALTYEERQSRLDGIKTGRYSIVYLSPELLLAYDIHSLIGERRIGLLVVDEAHLVTSWGRDFRVDYWFLGDYIEKIRRGSYYKKAEASFPILCLTATAVFGGRDDVIGDLQNSLHLTCYSNHMYIGYVRRNNIEFRIRHPKKEKKSDKVEKLALATTAISAYVEKKEKTIAYFPYKSQIEDVRTKLISDYPKHISDVEKYYSGEMRSMEKDEAYSNFRETKSHVMLATKAFGMGVNIGDIMNVYHYAPTGTLADYVQEIGRAARKLSNGYAITDYLKSDMRYAQPLWGLSGLRHYQVKAIIKKLYSLYDARKQRNLLFSPETFGYLFDARSVDMKVKSGLMLLSTDLLEQYHFKVIAVRPKNLFSTQYII
ncbi:MAG: ATP-dependent DNA helicase RecQ, partial [Clostridiaceae bacterium]|nr:ATP-dependent DNA helicase RecQ [Clostridiaceae bacterium]